MTPQYSGLESLYQRFKGKGFRILASPSNDFAGQEPLDNAGIKEFCSTKYKVTFDLFAKVAVKGDDQCGLYRYLTTHPKKKIAGDVAWNFQKYLVGRDGTVLAKFEPRTKPDDRGLIKKIKKALKAKAPKATDDEKPAPGKTGLPAGDDK